MCDLYIVLGWIGCLMFIEELFIDFVDGGKIIQIGDKYGYFDDIVYVQFGSNYDCFDVFEV